MKSLFTPTKLGNIDLANRIVMAPMTRSRASNEGVVSDITATYYVQRATAGLIVTEGVFPSAEGKGYVRTPGIETKAQIDGWKPVVEAVHDAGGRIVMQLMHTGRISHPSMQPGGQLPVAPSAIKPVGQAWTDEGQKDFVAPRALTIPEIKDIVEAYRRATRNALAIGFDGVELHGATGYLPEQFLSSGANHRTDEYGGSIENRARFLLDTLNAMISEAGPGRVGLKLSPEMNFNDIKDDTPVETFSYLVKKLPASEMTYLNVTLFGQPSADYHAILRPLFDGNYLIGGGLTEESAEVLVGKGEAAAAVFGQHFIGNPDLVERFWRNAPLAKSDQSTFYAPGPKGYIDYPAFNS